jgi:hypothetical protein
VKQIDFNTRKMVSADDSGRVDEDIEMSSPSQTLGSWVLIPFCVFVVLCG